MPLMIILLARSVRLALDGVFRAEVHVLLRGIDDDGSHDGGCRQFLVLNDQSQGVGAGHCFGAVRLLFRICLLCRLFFVFYTFWAAKLQKGAQINPRQSRKSSAEGESLNLG